MIEFQQKFIDDATDLITKLEDDLLDLEESKADSTLIESVFRTMHTLKGSSGMFGFNKIEKLTHLLENIFDLVREGKLEITVELINLSFESIDLVKKIFNDHNLSDKKLKNKYFYVVEAINEYINENVIETTSSNKQEVEIYTENTDTQAKTYIIYFYPDADIESRGVNLKSIFDELSEVGTIRIFPQTNKDYLENSDSGKFYLSWYIFVSSNLSIDDITDIFLFVEYERDIELISEHNLFDCPDFIKRLEQIEIDPEKINIEELKKLGDWFDNSLLETDEQVIEEKTDKSAISHIKVSSNKLDELMNLVSELITKQSELSIYSGQKRDLKLRTITDSFEQIIRRLRSNALEMRLVPLDSISANLKRLTRDLAVELKKEISFESYGTDTELDKNIIDSLSDPLMHIIRNCADHGIETADVRLLKGKSRKGTIQFKAEYSGTDVLITIKDDGAGINLEKVKEKALNKNLIEPGKTVSKDELLNLIITPGFSTAEQVSEVSGRGVGMDVVHKAISDLRGFFEVQTETNVGTSLQIRLPQTLSITDTLLVKVSKAYFIIPLPLISLCTRIDSDEISKSSNKTVRHDNELIPYLSLREKLKYNDNKPEKEKMVIINIEGKKFAIIVDSVVGEHQAVVKPLGKMFKRQDFISGASMLGDGSLAFMLDVNKLLRTI